jgi:hypothetical protein
MAEMDTNEVIRVLEELKSELSDALEKAIDYLKREDTNR